MFYVYNVLMIKTFQEAIYNCKNIEDRVDMVLSLTAKHKIVPHSEKYQREVCFGICARLKSAIKYQPQFRKLKSMVKLFKPNQATLAMDHDYLLQELCENPIEISTFEGNHLTITKNPQVGYAISNVIDTSSVYFKQSILSDQNEIESLKQISGKQI